MGTLQSVDLRHHVSIALEDVAVSLGPVSAPAGGAVAAASPSKQKFSAYMPGSSAQPPLEQAGPSGGLPSSQLTGASKDRQGAHPVSPSMYVLASIP